MPSLDEIESFHRAELKKEAQTDGTMPTFRAFVAALLVTPFVITGFLFIPFLGQAFAVCALFLSLLYVYTRRSWKLLGAGLAGAALGVLLISFLAPLIILNAPPVAYVLLALSLIMDIAYLVAVGGALWQFYEQGAQRCEKRPGGAPLDKL